MINVQINALNLLVIATPEALSGAHIILIQGDDVIYDGVMTGNEYRDLKNLPIDYELLGHSPEAARKLTVTKFRTGNENSLTILKTGDGVVIKCVKGSVTIHEEHVDSETTLKLFRALLVPEQKLIKEAFPLNQVQNAMKQGEKQLHGIVLDMAGHLSKYPNIILSKEEGSFVIVDASTKSVKRKTTFSADWISVAYNGKQLPLIPVTAGNIIAEMNMLELLCL